MLRRTLLSRWMLVLMTGCALAAAGCPQTTPPAPEPTPECTTDADCPDGQICDAGQCVDAPAPECEADEDCPDGQICDEGQCIDAPVGGPCTVEGADPEAGSTAFAASCSADTCHGADASGPVSLLGLEDVTGSMQDRFGGGANHMGATLTDDQIRDIACWLFQQG